MSKIQGKPFIELVVDTLGDLKADFLDLVNGSDKTPAFRSLITASAKITGADKNKVQYVVLETWSKTYTGYLIYNNTYCVLVAFSSNTQALTMLKIDVAKQTFITVKEYLDINELRRYLEEASEHITSGEIDSGEAEANALLVADGDGGAKFVSPEDGSAQYLLGLDSEGNIIKDELPEGIVVDQTIIENSENAVAGGAVYDALEEVGGDITDINAELETKANVNGNYPTMTVGFADNLTPYDESAGDDQDEPFILQATGTGNGTQQDFSTGSGALMKEKQGNTVVVNQYVTSKTTNTNNGITYTNNGDGSYTLSGIASANSEFYLNGIVNIPVGHKIFIQFLKTAVSGVGIFAFDASYNAALYVNKTDVYQNTTYAIKSFKLQVNNGTDLSGANAITIRPLFIDLTQWFNGDIPQDLLDNPSNFFRYYQGSLAYNEGTLVNADGRYIKCIGMNQWDEEWEEGSYSTNSGNKDSWQASSGSIRSKNKVKVIPNTTYYCKVSASTGNYILFYDIYNNYLGYVFIHLTGETFTTPSNACYIAYRKDGVSTYGNNTSINLYYEDEPRCLTYEPYEVLTNNDTGTEVLRSAGSVKDSKAPDGTITRRIGAIELKNLDWARQEWGAGYIFYATTAPSGIKSNTNVSKTGNIVCSRYKANTPNEVYDGNDKSICLDVTVLRITDSAYTDAPTFRASLDGVYLFYELDEPTTEQGTPYSENLVIDDFGSMDFGGDVPQGNLIFYPVDYKAFVDTLYNYADGTPSNIALKSDLPTAPQTWAESLPGYDATKTQTLKNVEGTLTWVDD